MNNPRLNCYSRDLQLFIKKDQDRKIWVRIKEPPFHIERDYWLMRFGPTPIFKSVSFIAH